VGQGRSEELEELVVLQIAQELTPAQGATSGNVRLLSPGKNDLHEGDGPEGHYTAGGSPGDAGNPLLPGRGIEKTPVIGRRAHPLGLAGLHGQANGSRPAIRVSLVFPFRHAWVPVGGDVSDNPEEVV
jgi:hypothetical protein